MATLIRFMIWAIPALGLLACAPNLAPFAGPGSGRGNFSETDRIFLMSSATWDSNHDGATTCDEWRNYLVELLESSDTSRDGTLGQDEFAAFARTDRLFAVADFAFWDADHDGKITRAELVERPNPAFSILDLDKDCVLTTAEISAARSLQAPPDAPPGGPPGGRPGGGGPPTNWRTST